MNMKNNTPKYGNIDSYQSKRITIRGATYRWAIATERAEAPLMVYHEEGETWEALPIQTADTRHSAANARHLVRTQLLRISW
jgi:hypothetical protein